MREKVIIRTLFIKGKKNLNLQIFFDFIAENDSCEAILIIEKQEDTTILTYNIYVVYN